MGKNLYKVSGIYCIKNKVSNKCYIGSAVNIGARFSKHRTLLKKGKHHSRHLQSSWDKHNEDNFDFFLLEEVPDNEKLIMIEQKHINDKMPEFNMCPTAGNCLGREHTDETKAKISRSLRGNQNFKGKRHTAETKEKMRQRHLGKKMSPESCKKMSVSRTGKEMPQDVRERISQTMKDIDTRAIKDEKTIREIRNKYENEKTSQRKLAKEYKVGRTVIKNILKRQHGYEEKFQPSKWKNMLTSEKFRDRVLDIMDEDVILKFDKRQGEAADFYDIENENIEENSRLSVVGEEDGTAE